MTSEEGRREDRPKREPKTPKPRKPPRARREKPIPPAPPIIAAYKRQTAAPLARIAAYAALALFGILFGAGFALNAPHNLVVFAAPIAIVLVLGIWALPPGEYAPSGAIVWLFMAFSCSLLLWPNYLAIALPGLPWITLVRLAGTPLLVILLICVSVSANFRKAIGEVVNVDPYVWRALVAFSILQGLSIAFSHSVGSSISRYIADLINWTGIFFAACIVFKEPGVVTRWAQILIWAGLLLCLVGILEGRVGHVLWAGHIPSFLKVGDEVGSKILAGAARAAVGVHRVQATSTTPLGLAEYLGLIMPFAMHIALGRYPLLTRALAIIYMPMGIIVILLADSRLGVVASFLSALAYVLIWAVRRWVTQRGSLVAPAIVLAYPAIFCAGIAATFLIGRLRHSIWGGGAEAASNESRMTQWQTGLPKVFTHPVGHGVGQAAQTLGYFAMDGTLTIDSYYLSLMLDYGMLGFLLYVSMFFRAVWIAGVEGMRTRSDPELLLLFPLSVALMNFIVIKAVFSQEDNHAFAFIMLGAVMALTFRARASAAAELAGASSGGPPETVKRGGLGQARNTARGR